MAKAPKLKRNEKALRAVRPNAGLQSQYRQKLDAIIRDMASRVTYWLQAGYKKNEPAIVQDELPATALRREMRRLREQWETKFEETAPKLAKWFSKSVQTRSDVQLRSTLKEGGFSVKFKATAAQRDILEATVGQNVALIRSIPARYFDDVENAVMRSVQAGRDLSELTSDLQKNFRVTRRRAELISLDQNNKATSAMNRARQQELGINRAVWVHSHAGKEPRPTHVAMDGKVYNVDKGMWDSDEGAWVHPGELIQCRCTSRPVVAGMT